MPKASSHLAPLSRRSIFAQAWPVILGQATVPLVSLTDVTVIGHTGNAAALAGVALGATIVTFLFWAFGFLRMGVTGLTAQAAGARDASEITATLWRALLLGAIVGLLLLLLSPLLTPLSLRLMAAPQSTTEDASLYITARFFGAPAALCFYALNGWLLGLGRTRLSLLCQLVLNSINIALDLLLTACLGMGTLGIGMGTAIADWCALLLALWLARRIMRTSGWQRPTWATLRRLAPVKQLMFVNMEIMVRTLALLFLLSWFARAGAKVGAVTLAANHLLMQFISVTSFVLDGFAFTAEERVGSALGAASPAAFRRAIRLVGELALGGALFFALLIFFGGATGIALITTDEAVRTAARAMLPFCAAIPLIGMPGWILDGIFIGATRGATLRNAALLVLFAYLLLNQLLQGFGNSGIWIALLSSYALRGLTLGVSLPGLYRHLRETSKSA